MFWKILPASLLALGSSLVCALSYYETDEELQLWRDIALPGHILVLEHAEASITEDPNKLDVPECYKHLNLTDHGKTQAKRYYNTLHRHDIQDALVYSSQWCRSIETATRLGLGFAHEQPMLNAPTSENPDIIKLQTNTLAKWLKSKSLKHTHVLVTNKDVIRHLTGLTPNTDEAIVLFRDNRRRISVKGRLPLIHEIR